MAAPARCLDQRTVEASLVLRDRIAIFMRVPEALRRAGAQAYDIADARNRRASLREQHRKHMAALVD